MKKTYLCLLIITGIFFASCDEDEAVTPDFIPVIDTESPVVNFTSPSDNIAFSVIERVSLIAELSDNVALMSADASISLSNNSSSSVVYENFSFNPSHRLKNTIIHSALPFSNIRLPDNVDSARYTLTLKTTDTFDNSSSKSVNLFIHAPNHDKSEFSRGFMTLNFYEVLDWYGVVMHDGNSIDETGLSLVLFLLSDHDDTGTIIKSEWERFVADFNLGELSWNEWDKNVDGNLDREEYKSGILGLKLFKVWDMNNNIFLSPDEFAGGLFDSWDTNKDKLLSRSEYHKKYYYYLIE